MKNRVLIINDDMDVCEALRVFMANRGYIVSFCTEEKKTLVKAKEFVPDIVLLEIETPGMDAVKVIEELKELDGNIAIYTTNL